MTSASAPSGACSAASQGSQSKPGAFVLQGGKRHERVGLLGIPVGDPIPGRRRQRRLQLHDLLGEPLRVGQPHELGEPGEMGDIGGADLGVRVVAVVRLVRQAQPGLAQVHQVAAGVFASVLT
jgi:hypothetical protein